MGGVAVSLGCSGSVCESRGANFLHYFGISDHVTAVERTREDGDDRAAGILCAESVPDSSGGDRVYVAGVCDLPARAALVSHDRSGVVPGEFRFWASVVSGAFVVVERGRAVLFLVAGGFEEVVPAPSGDSGRSGCVCAAVSRGLPFCGAARTSG